MIFLWSHVISNFAYRHWKYIHVHTCNLFLKSKKFLDGCKSCNFVDIKALNIVEDKFNSVSFSSNKIHITLIYTFYMGYFYVAQYMYFCNKGTTWGLATCINMFKWCTWGNLYIIHIFVPLPNIQHCEINWNSLIITKFQNSHAQKNILIII